MDAFEYGDPKKQTLETEYGLEASLPRLFNEGCAGDADGLTRERPEHRIIMYLKLGGKTNQEIAEITNYTYQHVCKVARQRWFLRSFVELAQENGKDALNELFRAESLNSVQTLIEIRDGGKLEANRRQAAEHLLDRFLGKPTQKNETNLSVSRTPSDQMEKARQTEKEIETLEKELGFDRN